MSKWPNFPDSEINCSHCGEPNTNPEFERLMDDVQEFRTQDGRPFTITSGYRCPQHPIEAAKKAPGWHSIAAIDGGMVGGHAIDFLKFMLNKGYVGVGIKQKGGKRFIHADARRTPAIWSY